MEQKTVSTFIPGDKFEGFLLVRSAAQRTSSNGSKYLDLTLCDLSGEINCKMWDGTVDPPLSGTAIKIRATVQEYNGRTQLRVEKMRPVLAEDEVDMSFLTPSAPEAPADMLEEIHATIRAMEWEDLKKLVAEMLSQCGDQLIYSPAAQKMHHAERSGLLHHTVSMLRAAKAVLPLYPFLNHDLLLAGVIVHDLSKVTEMVYDETGTVTDYSREGLLVGHLAQGAIQLQKAAEKTGVSGESVLLLTHMILSHHALPEYGSVRPPMFPEAEMLHFLDDMDAKMNEMETVMKRTAPGTFSEKIFGLDRRLYHPQIPETKETKSHTEGKSPFDPPPGAKLISSH